MIALQKKKHPEAEAVLEELAGWVRGYSLMFSPANPSHPAFKPTGTEVVTLEVPGNGQVAHRPAESSHRENIREVAADNRSVAEGLLAFRHWQNTGENRGNAANPRKKGDLKRGRPRTEKTERLLQLMKAGVPYLDIAAAHDMKYNTVYALYKKYKSEVDSARNAQD